MPIIILGLILLICLLIYSIVRYMNSGEEDSRPVRERYPEVFVRRYDQDDRPNKSDASSAQNNNKSKSDDDEIETITDFESYVDHDSFGGDIDHMKRNLKKNIKGFVKDHGFDVDVFMEEFAKSTPDSDESSSNDSSVDNASNTSKQNESDHIVFPTDNIEEEKQKRNIH